MKLKLILHFFFEVFKGKFRKKTINWKNKFYFSKTFKQRTFETHKLPCYLVIFDISIFGIIPSNFFVQTDSFIGKHEFYFFYLLKKRNLSRNLHFVYCYRKIGGSETWYVIKG